MNLEFYIDEKLVCGHLRECVNTTECAICTGKIHAGEKMIYVGVLIHVHANCGEYYTDGRYMPPTKEGFKRVYG